MATVPITLKGTLDLGTVDSTNFIIENCFDGQFTTYSGNNATTTDGINAIKAFLATFFTSALPNYPGGSVTTNEVVFNAGTRILDINVVGAGSNQAVHIPACIMVNAAEQNTNLIAFRFGSISESAGEPIACQECYDAHVLSCSDIDLELDFLPSTAYTILIIDSWDDQVRLSKTSDVNGVITIGEADIITIDNRPGAAPFSVRAFLESTNEPHQFIIGGSVYGCINLHPTAGAPTTAPDPLLATATST